MAPCVTLCGLCANAAAQVLGDARHQRAIAEGHVLVLPVDAPDAVGCIGCLGGISQTDAFTGLIVDAIGASAFVDAPALAFSPAVPRAVSFMLPAVCVWLARQLGDAFPATDADGSSDSLPTVDSLVPQSLVVHARETVAARVQCALPQRMKSLPDGAGGSQVVDFGRVDAPDTIIVDVTFDVITRGTGGVAFVARRTNDAQLAQAAVDSRNALALAFAALPHELQGNKANVPFTWRLVGDTFTNALDAYLAALPTAALTMRPDITVWRTPVYVYGRYRKMMRDVPQAPWFIGQQRFGRLSLQEVIAEHLLPVFYDEATLRETNGDGAGPAKFGRKCPPPKNFVESQIFGGPLYKFMSAGREDVDVRMLGAGRPFVFELQSPHRVSTVTAAELAAAERTVNENSQDVEIEGLCLSSDRGITNVLHTMSSEKQKHYRCVCWSSRALRSDDDAALVALNSLPEFAMDQQTPLRVLHRRSQMTRPKLVHSVAARRVSEHWLVVDLVTQAGAYIKEFCHGDMGRTRPSLGDLLGATCDIVQLDVVGVELDPELQARIDGMMRLYAAEAAPA